MAEYLFVYVSMYRKFSTFGKVAWKTNRSIPMQIDKFIEQLGDNFESVMTSYFEDFKKSMKQRQSIPISLVEKNFNDIFFLVDVDFTYVKDGFPRVRWLRPLPYEFNIDEEYI